MDTQNLTTTRELPEVERIEAPSWDRFERDYVDRGKPVVITGVVDGWRAISEWTPEYLKQTAGDAKVQVSFNERGDHGVAHRVALAKAGESSWRSAMRDVYPVAGFRKTMSFGELIQRLTADPPDVRYFLSTCRLSSISPHLLNDIDPERYVNRGRAIPVMFLGHDTYTPLHYHGDRESFLSLIVGRKRVTLYSPEQIRFLYPYPWYTPILNICQIDDRNVDHERFPKFQQARPIVADLRAGDLLFIPLQWIHSVTSYDLALGVTWFWKAKFRNYHFPTPAIPVYANKFVAPVSVWARAGRGFRLLRRMFP